MRCKFCAAPLPHRGLVCNYCGQRNPLNLGVITKIEIEEKNSTLKCPICTDTTMEQINIGIKNKTIIDRCAKCDGMFVPEDTLNQIISNQPFIENDFDHHMLRFIQDNPRHISETKVVYRKCPVCNKIMQRINYKAISGVIADVCLHHGVWLDGGELRQLLEWKKAGGETKIREEQKPVPKKVPKPIHYQESERGLAFSPIDDLLTWLMGG